MDARDVIEQLPITEWHGPFDAALRTRAIDALEAGRVLLAQLPFRVAPDEVFLLAPRIMGSERKNISLDPATAAISNTALDTAETAKLTTMMRRFGDAAEQMLRDLLPGYAAALQRARTSFRPAEIAGREYSPRHDDRLLHVDAFPSRPMRGHRILRVFCNVARDGAPRSWRVGEPFPDFAQQFLPRTRAALPGSAWLLEQLGITKGRRSEYDRIMLGLHDAGKLDAAYQSAAPKADVTFAAGTTWLCFTDQVLHAALAGHCALEQTFHLPVAAMAHPERSPLRVLERLAGRALT
ncbi:MAG TPA: Kdo hydroxylase family protein [Acetobacteraceae bacterium]|jgi:3-deoxy-D-manno-oct-2-ulosonic acid (Kdo) hydroxylase|nr:Kdo hydroxylase family protein [Acetobacteraceae bacterium]